MFTMKVKTPTEIPGMSRLSTYARHDSGAVPRLDLIASAIANAIMKRPTLATRYLTMIFPVLEPIKLHFNRKVEPNIVFFRNFAKYGSFQIISI